MTQWLANGRCFGSRADVGEKWCSKLEGIFLKGGPDDIMSMISPLVAYVSLGLVVWGTVCEDSKLQPFLPVVTSALEILHQDDLQNVLSVVLFEQQLLAARRCPTHNVDLQAVTGRRDYDDRITCQLCSKTPSTADIRFCCSKDCSFEVCNPCWIRVTSAMRSLHTQTAQSKAVFSGFKSLMTVVGVSDYPPPHTDTGSLLSRSYYEQQRKADRERERERERELHRYEPESERYERRHGR